MRLVCKMLPLKLWLDAGQSRRTEKTNVTTPSVRKPRASWHPRALAFSLPGGGAYRVSDPQTLSPLGSGLGDNRAVAVRFVGNERPEGGEDTGYSTKQ
ncbi:hypothetical protein BaRGS_00030030 [Batillaria attramentaria]|uniref:Uncharacterized protein n=1 Tax=Batillaria attramentaria TaxID=370345 RepID=A0ABD0JVE2_9CAEN